MTVEMWNKAQALIASDAREAWRAANVPPNGRIPHPYHPHTISARASAMIEALGRDDAETVARLILDWDYFGKVDHRPGRVET